MLTSVYAVGKLPAVEVKGVRNMPVKFTRFEASKCFALSGSSEMDIIGQIIFDENPPRYRSWLMTSGEYKLHGTHRNLDSAKAALKGV